MLKIIDNVDLKELEKFGFKPFYSCDTGKIIYWYKRIYDYNFSMKKVPEYIIIKICDTKICFDETIIFKRGKTKEIKNMINFNMSKKGDRYDLLFNILYDLIQAGLVEKIEY